MSERSSPFLSRTLLRTLSALLTICLLAQSFIAGIAVMTDPEWPARLGCDLLLLIAAGLAVGLSIDEVDF